MAAIAAGTAGLLLIILSDWADARRLPALKIAGTAAAAALFLYGLVSAVFFTNRILFPVWMRVLGGICAGIFFILSLFSNFIEVRPPVPSPSKGERRIVRSEGTYALVRHPGVLWLFFFQLSLAVAAESRMLLLALPFWTCANLLVVYLEDAVFFPALFGNAYSEYKKKVPFLVPTKRSVMGFISTIFRPISGRQGGNQNDGD